MKSFVVRHATSYAYARAVGFEPHRLMVRPRDSHDLRLVSASLSLSPPAEVRWVYDVFGNSVAVASFDTAADRLVIESVLEIERYPFHEPGAAIEPEAAEYPFTYGSDDRSDLGRTLHRHYSDPKGELESWAKSFVRARPTPTMALLTDINSAIRQQLRYEVREAEGTQTPVETLSLGGGSCRDYALLLMEAARCLGFGARFASGYLYDPALDNGAVSAVQGAGATHAWAEIFLPGPGWVEFDPTNGVVSEANLIRIATARDPAQAAPISGGYRGSPDDFLGMRVDVNVTARGTLAHAA